MLILYMRPWCPYCLRVLIASDLLGVTFEKKDIADNTIADELIARGGKKQVPYLIDTERAVEMYESKDIIAYLEEHYPSGAQ